MTKANNPLEEAKKIIDDYAQKCSTIDEGNLYFAATQFEKQLEAEREKVRKLVEALSIASAALNDISEFNDGFHNDSDIKQMVRYAKKKIKEIEET